MASMTTPVLQQQQQQQQHVMYSVAYMHMHMDVFGSMIRQLVITLNVTHSSGELQTSLSRPNPPMSQQYIYQ
jgi:hypothetical protein